MFSFEIVGKRPNGTLIAVPKMDLSRINGRGLTVKPGCKIGPQTPVNRPSTEAELVAWCNNLAESVGVHDNLLLPEHNPDKPGYHCTMETFGK